MPEIDKRLLHLNDPDVTENFNRVLGMTDKSIKKISLSVTSSGAVSGGTATLLDGSEVQIEIISA